ncbi:Probable receptor-like protein kinase At2g42960 [Linum perenne]
MEGTSPSKFAWHKVSFFCIALAAFFSHASGECALNFSEFPYQPTGECIGTNKLIEVRDLSTIGTTICCRNVLNTITKNLALRVSQTHGALFLPQYQWKDCTGPFPQQNSVSPLSCGFDVLYSGSGPCSSLSIAAMEQEPGFSTTVNSCSKLNASSFDDACSSCVQAIMSLTRHLLSNSYISSDDNTQAMICTVSVLVAIAGEKLDQGSSIDELFRCLPSIQEFGGWELVKFLLSESVVKEVGSVAIAVVTLLLVLILVKFVRRNKDKGKRKAGKPLLETQEVPAWSGLYRFSKNEIQNAMNYSSEKTCLGRGSAGQVYRGVLPSGQVVAIKHIHQGHTSDSFTREVEGLSRIRHPNLVCLFGCCIHGSDRYLVYEFCSAGNLAQHLLRKESALSWERRVKILKGCALGLRYLHHYIDGCIVHRDIKLTNILLTEELEPKLSDFGLAKMIGMEESKVFTEVRGTIGYMDPEYMSNAKLTCASDIYSFGIVILQILSGRKVIELDLDARDHLTRKAKDVSLGKRPLQDFEDPKLNGDLNREDFEVILQIAVLCVAKSSKGRPTIDVVWEVLEKAWKNTVAQKKTKSEVSSPGASYSHSMDVVPV